MTAIRVLWLSGALPTAGLASDVVVHPAAVYLPAEIEARGYHRHFVRSTFLDASLVRFWYLELQDPPSRTLFLGRAYEPFVQQLLQHLQLA